jgi:hypothetical protein
MKYFSFDENGSGIELHETIEEAKSRAYKAVIEENKDNELFDPSFIPIIYYGKVISMAAISKDGRMFMRDQRRCCEWRDSVIGKIKRFFYDNAYLLLSLLSSSIMIWFLTTLSPD